MPPFDIMEPNEDELASIEDIPPLLESAFRFCCFTRSSSNFNLARASSDPSSLTKYARILLLNLMAPLSSYIGNSEALYKAVNNFLVFSLSDEMTINILI